MKIDGEGEADLGFPAVYRIVYDCLPGPPQESRIVFVVLSHGTRTRLAIVADVQGQIVIRVIRVQSVADLINNPCHLPSLQRTRLSYETE